MFWRFCFLYFFRGCESRVTFSLHKTLITFSKILTLEWILVTVYKVQSISWKNLQQLHVHLYACLPLPSLFSLKLMACHFFPRTTLEWNQRFSHNVSPVHPRVLVTGSYSNNPSNILKKTSVRPSKNTDEKEKKKFAFACWTYSHNLALPGSLARLTIVIVEI